MNSTQCYVTQNKKKMIAKNLNRKILRGSYRREKAKGKRSMGSGTGMYNIDTYYYPFVWQYYL